MVDIKIRNIGDYKFADKEAADQYDYLYRKYLDLPFDFSMQFITGNDVEKIHSVYEAATQDTRSEGIEHVYFEPYELKTYYEDRLVEFDDIIDKWRDTMDNIVKKESNYLRIFFYMPEAYLSIKQQQTYMHDCLERLKKKVTREDGTCIYKHINFVIATTSLFMLSDCFPGNMIIVDDKPISGVNEWKDKMFAGNLYTIARTFVYTSVAGISNKILEGFGELATSGHCDIEPDFIGDDFIRNMYKETIKDYNEKSRKQNSDVQKRKVRDDVPDKE